MRSPVLVIDTRPTFLSTLGLPLAGGRLQFFLYETITPSVVFSDFSHIVSVGSEINLTSAGWLPFEVYSPNDLTIHVQQYLGMDEFGNDSYQTVKVLNLINTSVTPVTPIQVRVVDTINDLRDTSVAQADLVAVKGYYTAFDAPVRYYKWNEDSTALDNLGTVIASNIESNGRWLHTPEDGIVDARVFGIIPGLLTVNSHLSQALGWAQANSFQLHFTKGTYTIAGGSTITTSASIRVDDGVLINAQSAYTITFTNPLVNISSTFAGTNLTTIYTGDDFINTLIPVTAFNASFQGLSTSVNKGTLYVPETITISGAVGFDAIQVAPGAIATLNFPSVKTLSSLKGAVILTGQGVNVEGDLYVSQFSDELSVKAALLHTRGRFIFDEPFTGISGDFITYAMVEIRALVTFTALVEFAITPIIMTGMLGSTAKFTTPIKGSWFNNPILAVDSFVASTGVSELDMEGRVTDRVMAISKDCIVRNGTVGRINNVGNKTKLYDVVIDVPTATIAHYCVNSAEVLAYNCTFRRNAQLLIFPPDSGIRKLYNCIIETNTPGFGCRVILSSGSVMRDCKYSSGDPFATWLVPNNQELKNVSITNCNMGLIMFDAFEYPTGTAHIARNITIRGNTVNHIGGIDKFNAGGKEWAIGGHYSIDIAENYNAVLNKPCKTTSYAGWTVATAIDRFEFTGTRVTLRTNDLIFYFNTSESYEPLADPRPTSALLLHHANCDIINIYLGGVPASVIAYATRQHPMVVLNSGNMYVYVQDNVSGFPLTIKDFGGTNDWQYNLTFKVYP